MFNKELTQEEKIDYIYNHIRSQKRWSNLKLFIKISIIWYILYIYLTFDIKDIFQKYTSMVTPVISSIVKPISQDVINSYIDDSSVNLNQDMINKISNNLLK